MELEKKYIYQVYHAAVFLKLQKRYSLLSLH